MPKLIQTFIFSLILVVLSSSYGFASDGVQMLFHVKTGLDQDDAQICVVPNVAWAALNKGHDVTLLFDGSAVTSVKKGGFFDSTKTDMDRADLPERERKALAEQFNFPLEQIPHNYGEYLQFIKKLGAKLYINRTMMLLYNIEPEEIDSVLEPISLSQIIDLMENAKSSLFDGSAVTGKTLPIRTILWTATGLTMFLFLLPYFI